MDAEEQDLLTQEEQQQPERRRNWLMALALLLLLLLIAWLLWRYAQLPDGSDSSGEPGREVVAIAVVPDVVGMDADSARVKLTASGFTVEVDSAYDSVADPGTVASQEPKAGTRLEKGFPVAIAVAVDLGDVIGGDSGGSEGADADTSGSSGRPADPDMVRMPDLLGLKTATAESRARAAGLDPKTMVQPQRESRGRVYEQSPAPGTSVPEGEKVFILVGQ